MEDIPFALVTIDVKEEPEDIQSFMDKYGYNFKVLLDYDGFASHRYRVSQHPMKFLISPEGKVVAWAVGYRPWGSEAMNLLIRKVSQGNI